MAKRKPEEFEADALEALKRAKTRLVVSGHEKGSNGPACCFFGTLIMQLRYKADWTVPTAEVDGIHMFYNPAFIAGLNDGELRGLLAHEAMHCTNKHFARLGNRDAKLFNIACDLAINGLLIDAGLTLPKNGMFPGQGMFAKYPKGLSAEEYYSMLLSDPDIKIVSISGSGDGNGDPGNDPGQCGGFRKPQKDDGSPLEQHAVRQLERQWDQNLSAAGTVGKMRGKLPGSIERHCESLMEPVHNWREELRQYVTATSKDNHNWERPNRRFASMGHYLPSRFSKTINHIVCVIDTSGSIDKETMTRFASEIADIARMSVIKMTVIYHHSNVYLIETFEDGNPFRVGKAVGGGTSHVPVFEAIEKLDPEPEIVVLLTDLESCFPKDAPGYPVLWACINERLTGPFGDTIHIPPK